MNFSVHLFGINNGRFIQHPSDGTSEILRQCAETTEKGAMLTIRRNGTLAYYIYVRDISDDNAQRRVIGFCLTFNGVYVNDVHALSKSFERILSQIVMTGKLLKLNRDGSIIFNLVNFSDRRQDIEQTELYIKVTIEESLHRFFVQFKQNFSGQIGTKTLPLKTSNVTILDSMERFNVVRLYTDENQEVGYISKMMSQLNEENRKLHKELQKLSRQKKQFKNVVFLLLVIISCGIGIYFLNDNLNTTQAALADAKSEIYQKKSTINKQNERISQLTADYNNLKEQFNTKTTEYNQYKEAIIGYQPFLFKNTSFNFNSGELKVSYYGLTEGDYNITVRVIKPDHSIGTYDDNVHISKGANDIYIYISSYFDSGKYYIFELMYNNKVIGGGRH